MYSKNIDVQIAPASITKIMTALVFLDHFEFEDLITISLPENYEYAGKVAYLKNGVTITVEDLLEFLLIYSANDAAYAIAMAVSNDVDLFVDKMNKKAENLGMLDTNFVNPDGLDEANHRTTLSDLLLMSLDFIENYKLIAITSKSSFSDDVSGNEQVYYSTNQIIDKGFIGIKTGWTANAGLTFAGLNLDNDRQIITIVNKSFVDELKTNHFIDTELLYYESLNNFGYFQNFKIDQPIYSIRNSSSQSVSTSKDEWKDFLNLKDKLSINFIKFNENTLNFDNTISSRRVRVDSNSYEVIWKFKFLDLFSIFAN